MATASIDNHSRRCFEETLLLRLAVLGHYMTEEQLRRGLLLHRQAEQQGQQLPLGDLLLEHRLLGEMDYVDLLAAQQSLLGKTHGDGPIRLTERENRLLGELVIAYELADAKTLEACRLAREAWLRQGVERKLGELLLELGVLSWGYLADQLTAAGAAELWSLPAGSSGPQMIEPENVQAMRQSRLRAIYFSRRRTTRRSMALFKKSAPRRA